MFSIARYQVLAVATDAKSKEETLNIRSGKRVAVSGLWHYDTALNVNYFCVGLHMLHNNGVDHSNKNNNYSDNIPCCFCVSAFISIRMPNYINSDTIFVVVLYSKLYIAVSN